VSHGCDSSELTSRTVYVVLKMVEQESGDIKRFRVSQGELTLDFVVGFAKVAFGPSIQRCEFDGASGDSKSLSLETFPEFLQLVKAKLSSAMRLTVRTQDVAVESRTFSDGCDPMVQSEDSKASSKTPRAKNLSKSRHCSSAAAPLADFNTATWLACTRLSADRKPVLGKDDRSAELGRNSARPRIVTADQLRCGMRLLVESTSTGKLLQFFPDGRVDCDGNFEHLATFTVDTVGSMSMETVVCLRAISANRYLRCKDGYLDCDGQGPDEAFCHFSIIDVLDGIVLILGPPGTGHVCARAGSVAPVVTRVAHPQGFRLLAPAVGKIPALAQT